MGGLSRRSFCATSTSAILSLQKVSYSSSPVDESQIRGLALLMVLSAREVYEGKLAGDSGCSWFALDSPAEVMSHFERNLPLNETCWRLLGSTCDVSIEVLDFCSSTPSTIRFGNAQNSVHWLRVSTSMAPQPLFYVPDN
uniref:Pecanex-like protein n=1 Tax=Angiostrongylus cantonensis TaxID=6313 RepID=A0A0K0DCL5_ANGCA